MKTKTILHTTALSLLLAGGLFAQNDPFGGPSDEGQKEPYIQDTKPLDYLNADERKKAGITVRTVDPELLGMAAGHDVHWIEISFDCSKLEDYQPVMMSLQVVGVDKKMISAHYAERKLGDKDSLKLLFAITEQNQKNSHLYIFTPQVPGKKRIYLHGYSIFIDELVKMVPKPAPKPANYYPPEDEPADKK